MGDHEEIITTLGLKGLEYIWGFPKMVVPPKHLKMIIFSRKTHGFVGYHHFRKHPYIPTFIPEILPEMKGRFIPVTWSIWDMSLPFSQDDFLSILD